MIHLQFVAPETADFATLDRVITTLEVDTSEP